MRTEYREEPCRTALNRVSGMMFRWSLNPYMGCAHRCTFCYVRAFERRADRPADARYGTSIRVKTNIATMLREELARRSWKHEQVAIGTATDPYQPAEGTYQLTRQCLDVLATARTPASVVTRGPLVVRDIDVLQALAARAGASVSVSVASLDERAWRLTEPGTAPPRQRLRAVRLLAEAGIEVGVAIAPILPGISDEPRAMAETARAARDSGAKFLWGRALYLPPGTRQHFMEALARDWPDQAGRYGSLYSCGSYLRRADEKAFAAMVDALRLRFGFAEHGPAGGGREEPVQLALIR